MKVTGYMLMAAIKEHAFARENAENAFVDSRWKYESEVKDTPEDAMYKYMAAESNLITVQCAQAEYNQRVIVQLPTGGKKMTLGEAIKRVGMLARIEKQWRDTAKPRKARFSYLDEEMTGRDPDKVYAERGISVEGAQAFAKAAAKVTNEVRVLIQVGNATEIDMELDPALFE